MAGGQGAAWAGCPGCTAGRSRRTTCRSGPPSGLGCPPAALALRCQVRRQRDRSLWEQVCQHQRSQQWLAQKNTDITRSEFLKDQGGWAASWKKVLAGGGGLLVGPPPVGGGFRGIGPTGCRAGPGWDQKTNKKAQIQLGWGFEVKPQKTLKKSTFDVF